MNKQNFKNGNAMFPISTDALDFLQEQTLLVAQLTTLAGSRVIIRKPTSSKDGLCVFDGELLPLTGDTIGTHIQIAETGEDIIAHGTTYTNARVIRQAVYTNGNGEDVNTFVVLDNMITLKTAIASLNNDLETEKTTRANNDVPKKTIIDWYGNCKCDQVPNGWIPCGYFFKKANSLFNPGNEGWLEIEKWKEKYPGITIEAVGVSSQEKAIYISQCKGTTIPNLTDSYIVQAGGTYNLGSAGGSNTMMLKIENIPPHKHSINIGDSGYKHDHANSGVFRLQSGLSTFTDSAIYDNGNSIVTESDKYAKSFDNRPKSFALYKLIKVI